MMNIIYNIATDAEGHVWIVSESGMLQRLDGRWRQVASLPPLPDITALVCAGDILIAGGGAGQIAVSDDAGQSWLEAEVDAAADAITCLVLSPSFETDGVVLAGTESDGMLRSSNGGRHWDLANYGLQDLLVMALASAPRAIQGAVVFASTGKGVYVSADAGRAWKRAGAGLREARVQALAVSPDFARDRQVFAGTTAAGVFRSPDGGATWHACNQGIGSAAGYPAITSLWLHPDFPVEPVCLAGASEGGILRSQDGGASWTCVADCGGAVLCLASATGEVFAGTYGDGIRLSTDGGLTWREG